MKKRLFIPWWLLTPFVFGQVSTTGWHRTNQVLVHAPQSANAQVIANATVYVTNTNTGAPAIVYSDPVLSVRITSGIVTADKNGNYDYYLPLNYCVNEQISSPGMESININNVCGNTGTITTPVPLVNGGTGATTAAGAVTNLIGYTPVNKAGDTMTGALKAPTLAGSVNLWQNPLAYGTGSNQSATTETATASSGSGTLTLSSAGDFVVGQGVMIQHGGNACGSTKSTTCPLGPTPTVTPHGTAGSTTYAYQLACIDGLGGSGVAGAAGNTNTGSATLTGQMNGAGSLSGNYNRVTWTGVSNCYEVAIYRNGALIGTQWSGAGGTQTFNDLGLSVWNTSGRFSATPPSSGLNDNYDGIITAITGTTATVSPNLGSNVSTATMYHDDSPLVQAAINASPFVDIPQGNYVLRYPINYTKHNTSFTNAGAIRGVANVTCDTGDICMDMTGAQNIFLNDTYYQSGGTVGSSPLIYISRDTSNGDLAQQFVITNLSLVAGNATLSNRFSPFFGGRGWTAIYNHAGEVHNYYNLQFQAQRWIVFTSTNIDKLTSVFSPTDDRSPQSMSEVQCIGCKGSGGVFGEFDNAYSIAYFGGYGLGALYALGPDHPWGFEVDSGQSGHINITSFRIEGKNGLISVAPSTNLQEPLIWEELYRNTVPPYLNATTPQIFLNSGATLQNAQVLVDDFGGGGANFAAVVDGVNCSVADSTLFIGVWETTGGCNGGTLTGANNVLVGHGQNDGALLQSYPLTGSQTAPAWVKLGTWVNGNQAQGNTLKITLFGGYGFNAGRTTQAEADILIRMGNQGSAPNLAGVQMVTYGSTGATPGSTIFDQIKVAATGGSTSATNNSWDIYIHENFTYVGGSYKVDKQISDQWVPIDATTGDPGSASSSLVVGTVNVAAIQRIPASFTALTASTLAVGTSGATINADYKGSGTLTYTSITAPGCQEQPLTITGAAAGDSCYASTGSADIGTDFYYGGCRVSASNTADVKVCATATGIPAAVTWTGWTRH